MLLQSVDKAMQELDGQGQSEETLPSVGGSDARCPPSQTMYE